MGRALRDIGRLVFNQFKHLVIAGDPRNPRHHDPMLRPMHMLLQGQALARHHANALGFMSGALIDNLIPSPGSVDPPVQQVFSPT